MEVRFKSKRNIFDLYITDTIPPEMLLYISMRIFINCSFTGSLKTAVYPRAKLTWFCPEKLSKHTQHMQLCFRCYSTKGKKKKKKGPIDKAHSATMWNTSHHSGRSIFSCLVRKPIDRISSLKGNGSSSQGRLLLLARWKTPNITYQHLKGYDLFDSRQESMNKYIQSK